MATPRKPAFTPSRQRHTPSRARASNNKPPLHNNQGEEGIQVAIRMRPLNKNETSNNGEGGSVWKVLTKYNSVAQCTVQGKPLPNPIEGRNFFRYDKTFGQENDTKNVYDSVAKNIVNSVCSGLNGTIFAYGQTSSGKTYTMQGSGTIAEGQSAGTGGIVHMAAQDIFQHIASQPDRVFLVRSSFLEIYNEEVRDLLNESRTLQVREDPRRGVFVQSHEEIVQDFSGLLGILFRGEKSRAFASTAMNERSSRSHTIFRITIESRQKDRPNDENTDDNMETDDGAVRVSTLNLVDLAGSESVRHTGATGDRQKEGGMINQSLLTLSRVIVALGTPNQTHINFRDSKLTRILQSSLSGNARITIICHATPSQLYLEETRSTLLFASRAKLVKTNAQVNEVLDDRSLIRRLQRELAEARRHGGGGVAQTAHVKALQQQAYRAGTEAKVANDKLKRLCDSLLNNTGGLFGGVPDSKAIARPIKRQRRFSEGANNSKGTPNQMNTIVCSPKTVPRHNAERQLSPNVELSFLRQALSRKSATTQKVLQQFDDASRLLQSKESELIAAMCSNELVKADRDKASNQAKEFAQQIESMQSILEATKKEHDDLFTANKKELSDALGQLEQELEDKRVLEETVDSLQDEKMALSQQVQSMQKAHQTELASLQLELAQARSKLEESSRLNTDLQAANEQHIEHAAELQQCLEASQQQTESNQNDHQVTVAAFEQTIQDMETSANVLQGQLSSKEQLLQESKHERETLNEQLQQQGQELESTKDTLAKSNEELCATQQQLSNTDSEKTKLIQQLDTKTASYELTVTDLQQQLESLREEHEASVKQSEQDVATLQRTIESNAVEMEDLNKTNTTLSTDLAHLSSDKDHSQAEITKLESELEAASGKLTAVKEAVIDLEASLVSNKEETTRLVQELEQARSALSDKESTLESLQQQLSADKETTASTIQQLQDEKSKLENQVFEMNTTVNELTRRTAEQSDALDQVRAQLQASEQTTSKLEAEKESATASYQSLQKNLEETQDTLDKTKTSVDDKHRQLSELQQQNEELFKSRDGLQHELQETHSQVESLSEKVEKLSEELILAQASKDRAGEELQKLESQLADANSALLSSEQSTADTLAEAKTELSRLQDKLVETTASTEEQLLSAKEEFKSLEARDAEAQIKISGLTVALSKTEQDLGIVSVEKRRLQNELAAASNSQEDLTQQMATSTLQLDVLTRHNTEAQGKISGLTVVLSKAEETIARISMEKDAIAANASEQLERQQSLCCDLQVTSDQLQSELQETIVERDALAQKYQAATEQLQVASSPDKIDSLLSEKNQLQEEMERQSQVHEQEALAWKTKLEESSTELKKERSELLNIHDQLEQTNERLNAAKARLEDVSDNNDELKRLLAESNESVETARQSETIALDQLSSRSEELELCKRQLETLESQLQAAGGSDAEPLIQSIQYEKQKSEEQVAILQAREDQLKLAWEEERRELIRDAEQEMEVHRTAAKAAEEQSQRLQAEAYAAREMKETLEEQIKSDTNRTIQLESRLSSLENENTRMRRAASRQDSERQSNIAALQQAKADRDAAQASLKQLERQLQESESNHVEERRLLAQQVERLKDEIASCERLDAKNRLLSAEAEKLRKQNDASEEKARIQGRRIKRLEKRAITDDQFKQIKKLREDNAKMTKQLAMLKDQLSGNSNQLVAIDSSASVNDDEMAKLRFDADALETQRKKLSKQCQLLQDDQLKLTKILRSSKLLHGNEDVATALVRVVDKLSSLEQQYNTRLKSFQHQNQALQDQLSQQGDRLATYENTKAEEQEASHDAESEIRTLRQENLRLLKELKEKKKQLVEKKAELEMIRSVDDSYRLPPSSSSQRPPLSSKRERPAATSPISYDRQKLSASKESVTRSPKRRRQPRSVAKENSSNKEGPSSAYAKRHGKDGENRRAAGLGEAFALSEENTQECQQQ